MKRMSLVVLASTIAAGAVALAAPDASALIRHHVGVGAHHGVYGAGGVYRRTARHAYRRAAYAGVASGIGWNGASYWGTGAAAVGAAAAVNNYNNSYNSSYSSNYDNSYGYFGTGTFRRTGDAYYQPAVGRVSARRLALATSTDAGWSAYPTRAEYLRGYVNQGFANYYGPRCNPMVDLICR